MAVPVKRVFYVRSLPHPGYTQMLDRRPDVILDKLDNETDDAIAAPILAQGARLPDHFDAPRARAEILRRRRAAAARAESAARLDLGGGLRHRQSAGLHRRGRAGGEPGRREPRGGGRARARHDAVPRASASPRSIARCGAKRNFNRVDFMGHDVFGKTIGIVGLGHVGAPRRGAVRRPALRCASLPTIPISRPPRSRRAAPRRSSSPSCCAAPTSFRSTARSPTRRAA